MTTDNLGSRSDVGAKVYKSLHDFIRHGQHLWVTCRNGHCDHHGVVDAWSAQTWFRLHRITDNIDGFADTCLNHFRCTRCGAQAGRIMPTEAPITVTDFFPADEKGWAMLVRRLRG